MNGGGEEETTLEDTPTWVVALVCIVIVTVSLTAERFLHFGGKFLKKRDQKPLYEALEFTLVPYKMIGNWIIESKVEEQFEILFVIYALGILLCPTASIKVSDALLKVIVATKEDFREYDWCTFVLNELCTSIGEYKKKFIACKIFHWAPYKHLRWRMRFISGMTLRSRGESRERESKKGLLLLYGDEVGRPSTELHPESALTHPVSMRSSFYIHNGDVNDEVQSEEEEPCTQNEEDGEEDVGDIEKEDEDEDEGSKATGEDEGSESEGHTSQEGEQSEHNNDSTEDELNVGEEFKNLRKSTRIKRPAIGSPWVVTTVGKKRPKHENDKKALYQLCTTRCTEEEELEEFVDMYDYFLNRVDLQCLGGRQWISDRFMSMVAKTLVGDELKKSGHVRRHIFSSELMQKMANNLHKWSLEAHEKELLPEHIGYNIGDCNFIVGPTLHLSHWFCYIFDIKTMCFYAIDSYVDNLTYLRIQNEEEEATKGSKQPIKPKRLTKGQREMFKTKDWLASRCVRAH
ncbi:hypothetical protein K1719_022962 [Acacia pycnantha]|nr:hypothetical protein K1719_022962 [Acacia pycnantha]